MQVSEIDNVKIYNLSAGKSLPDWLSERKRRALLKKDVDIRRRIELIQDFNMPGLSTNIKVSKDGQYILATGIYKPRVKCFEVNNLSLKFERCLDSEVVAFDVLGEDYTKLVFLQCDRYVEFHIGHGRHYRLRVPRFGRDLAYHRQTCDLFVVGASSDIYRLNLEAGQFMSPYNSSASSINKCVVNPEHGLVIVGTNEGKLQGWDPRTRTRQAVLDCAVHCSDIDDRLNEVPSVTALTCHGGLNVGVGTSTGHVLLYDLRSSNPLIVKDHMNGLPIKDVVYHRDMDYVYSMDSSVLKIWDKNTSKQYTSIEGTHDLNNLCVVPGSGLLFLANEDPKMLTYYIPSLGPAPRWCAFIDNLTEELESTVSQDMYDNYKFITKQELETLGLTHLMGTNLLRAYMHGYFIDIRLYKKAKSIADPFAFEEFKRRRIREKIEQDRPSRLKIKTNLPAVNKDLAVKLMSDDYAKKKKKTGDLMADNRFKALFENPDFEVDKESEEFRLLNPVTSLLTTRKSTKKAVTQQFDPVHENDDEEKADSDQELYNNDDDDSSDDEHTWTADMKNKLKQAKMSIEKSRRDEEEIDVSSHRTEPKFYELKPGQEFKGGFNNIKSISKRANRSSLGERLKQENHNVKFLGSIGNREMTYSMKGDRKDRDKKQRDRMHREDRMKLHRPTNHLGGSKFKSYKGKKR